MSEDRRRALELAVAPRIKPWALKRLLDELCARPQVTGPGDAIARRDYGRHGHLEITIVEAPGRLASRYLAVSRLPEGERDVYIDALLDDALDERDGVATVTIADIELEPPGAGVAPAPDAATGGAAHAAAARA